MTTIWQIKQSVKTNKLQSAFTMLCLGISLVFAGSTAYSAETVAFAKSKNVTTDEDVPLLIYFETNQTPSFIQYPNHGILVPGTQPDEYIYTPFEDYSGEDLFTYRYQEENNEADQRSVLIYVVPVNDPPIAHDMITSSDGRSMPIQLGAHDPENDYLEYVMIHSPLHGSLEGKPPAVVYHPKAGFNGYDSFTFKVNDGEYETPLALVSIVPGSDSSSRSNAPAHLEDQALPNALDVTVTGPTRIRAGEPWQLSASVVSNIDAAVIKFEVLDTDIPDLSFNILGQQNQEADVKWEKPVAREAAYHLTLIASDNNDPPNQITKEVELFVMENQGLEGLHGDAVNQSQDTDQAKSGQFQSFDRSQTGGSQASGNTNGQYFLAPGGGYYTVPSGGNNSNTQDNGLSNGGGDNGNNNRPGPNQAPQVDAGDDQALPWPARHTFLNAVVQDDGNPDPPASLTIRWSKVSGPGNVSFENPNLIDTNVTFSSEGTYGLKLTADDSELQDSDEVTITLLPQNIYIIQASASEHGHIDPAGDVEVREGEDQSFAITPDEGFQVTEVLVDGESQGAVSSWVFHEVSRGHTIHAIFSQIQLDNEPPVANAGVDQEHTLDIGQSEINVTLDGSSSSDPDGTVEAYIWHGTPDPDDVAQPAVTLGEGVYQFDLTVVDDQGAHSEPDIVQVTIHPEPNVAPIIEEIAGVDVSDGLPNPVVIDNVTEGEPLSFLVRADDLNRQNVVEQELNPLPNGALFQGTPANPAVYTFSWTPEFNQSGTYLLDLTASDSALSDQHQIELHIQDREPPIVTVNPPSPNQGHFNLEWNQIPSASLYQVQLSPDPSFQTNVDERWPTGLFEPFVIEQEGTYYARVQAWTRPSQEGGSGTGFSGAVEIVVEIQANRYDLIVNHGTGSGTYDEGTVVPIGANIPNGYHFTEWTGDLENVADPFSSDTEVTMLDHYAVTANFSVNTYTLDIQAQNGSVQKVPDQATYEHGTPVELSAVPNPGYHFVEWQGDLTGSNNPDTIVMDDDKSVTAVFAINTYTITASAGTGGAINPVGDVIVNYGDNQSFIIQEDTGYHILDVLVDNNSVGAVSSYEFQNVTTNHTIEARFEINTYPLVTQAENGSITRDPDQSDYEHGTNVTLEAVPDEGYSFVRWEGDLSGGENPEQITMDGPKSVTAIFSVNTYTLDIQAQNGSVQKVPDQATYEHGTPVELSAVPNPGYHFVEWQGDLTGSNNPDTIVMDDDKSVTAVFAINTYTITASAGTGGAINPVGDVIVNYGDNQSFIIQEDTGYHILDVLVDNNSVGAVSSYEFQNVTTNHTIEARFERNNELPVADAGVDQQHTLSYGETQMEVVLDGSNSYDPDGAVIAYDWTGAPDPDNIEQPTVLLSEGIYVFTLTVEDNDGGRSNPDQVTITIDPAPTNQAPEVNAGDDQEITLPQNQVTLDGSAADDGLPINVLNTLWTKESGPGNVVFDDSAQTDSTATFDQAGTYVLRLTADDTELQSFDEMTVNILSDDPCLDPNRDEYYFLKESDGLQIDVRPDGKSFIASLNGVALRSEYPSQLFYRDQSSGALDIDYQIVQQPCGGVDIIYTVSNPTNDPQDLPDFEVDGFQQAQTGDWYYLNTKDLGNLEKIDRLNTNRTFISRDYPDAYAPVLVTKDDQAGMGSSFIYPMLDYKHRLRVKLQWIDSGQQINTWRHWYNSEYKQDPLEGGQIVNEQIGPNENRTYKIAVRFTNPRYWLLTLSPYKEFFQSYYGSYNGRPADLRPVYKVNVANTHADATSENPRRYNLNTNLHDPNIGWTQLIDYFIGPSGAAGVLNDLGYERLHIWLPSGRYEDNKCCNFPPAFMDFLPYLADSAAQEFPRFAADGKELGFWWGRADQVPIPVDANWNEQNTVEPADYHNPEHIAFMTEQLQQALTRGAQNIGLDNFVRMLPWDKYQWTLDMVAMAPDVRFAHEGSGGDLFHSKIGNWYYPFRWGRTTQPVPDLLSHYLNPQSDIWVQQDRDSAVSFQVVQQLVSWGFTPILQRDLDVHNLDYTIVECFDGIDNDNDGFVDFPYDSDCLDETGNDESGNHSQAVLDITAEKGIVVLNPPGRTYDLGTHVELEAVPDPGYHLVEWQGDLTGSNNPDTIVMDDNKSITAVFEINIYTITASANTGGTIDPSGDVMVTHGEDQAFSIAPDLNFHIEDVFVDGESQGPIGSYEFQNVTENHTIEAVFRSDLNQPPLVEAGQDQEILWPTNSVNLDATVTDDGLLYQTPILIWTKEVGPGTVTFDPSNNVEDPTVLFSEPGTYVLRLTADDGEYQPFDLVTVVVDSIQPPDNEPPVVDAGSDEILTSERYQFNLNGTATDDGNPNGQLTAWWIQIGGPDGQARFADRFNLNTQAVFLEPGTYILRLTADDGELQSYDDMVVSTPIHKHGMTMLGLHTDIDHVEYIHALRAQVVRGIYKERDVKAFLQNQSGRLAGFNQNAARLKNEFGVKEIVFTLRWPAADNWRGAGYCDAVEGNENPTDCDYVPEEGPERDQVLDDLEQLLVQIGPSIDWFQIGNEVIAGPGRLNNAEITGGTDSSAMRWLTAVSDRARQIIRDHPIECGHLQIVSPALNALGIMDDPDPNQQPRKDFIVALIPFANQHTDAFDAHLNVAAVYPGNGVGWHESTEGIIQFLRDHGLTAPLTSLEWSEARTAWNSRWMANETDPNILARVLDPGNNQNNAACDGTYNNCATNGAVIMFAYDNPLDYSLWKDFVETAPHDPSFIENQYNYLLHKRFLHAAYSATFQYGNPNFDWRALVASFTVHLPPLPTECNGLENLGACVNRLLDEYGWTPDQIAGINVPFFTEFRLLARQINRYPILGHHANSNPDYLWASGAIASRMMWNDRDSYQNIANARQKLKALKERNITTVVTTHIFDFSNPPPNCPRGDDKCYKLPDNENEAWDELMRMYTDFVQSTCGYVDYYQIANEVVSGPGMFVDEDIDPALNRFPNRCEGGESSAICWLEAKTLAIHDAIAAHPECQNAKVVGPALTGILTRARGGGRNQLRSDFIDDIFNMVSNPVYHFAALDIHLNVSVATEMEEALNYVWSQGVRLPLVSFEWSQTKAGFNWLREPTLPVMRDYVQQHGCVDHPEYESCDYNGQAIMFLTENPIPFEEEETRHLWRQLIDTAPFQPGFMYDAYKVMKKHGLMVACMGALQHGTSALFDWRAIYTNKTIEGNHNDPPIGYNSWGKWFRNQMEQGANARDLVGLNGDFFNDFWSLSQRAYSETQYIRTSSSAGGHLTPEGNVAVRFGYDKTFQIVPDQGFRIADVQVDGQSVGPVSEYTFDDVIWDHTISAAFTNN